MRSLAAIVGMLMAALAAPKAQALCIYDGELDVRTTISREFRDAHWVVRAKVVGARDRLVDEGDSWTIYQLEVEQTYKGSPPRNLNVFTFRNSGGFYMDRPWTPLPEGHDIGGEYLLFLNPVEPNPALPEEASGAAVVNYNCGVSGPWSAVSMTSRQELLRLGG